MQKLFPTAAVCVVLVAAFVAADGNDWPTHDHDAGGQRFSPLEQITPANVATLQRAWTFDTGVTGLQVTPLVTNGIMYVTAGKDIIALDACAHTVPMTFLGKDGRQYVVVAAGGGSYLGAKPGSKIVAFALPSGAL